ncbi:Nn.00g088500.m01.CDS01 [Neocucurbitaria sp. VM-36]
MSEEQSGRRSRGRQPQSYRFEDEYSFLDEDGSGASGTQTPALQQDSQDEGDDFMPDAQEEEPEDDLDEDVIEEDDEEVEEEEESDEDFDVPKPHSARNINITEIDFVQEPSTPTSSRSTRKVPSDLTSPITPGKGSRLKAPPSDGDKLRTRGVADFSKIGGQEIRLKDLFGPGSEDLKPVLATRDYWYKQETLPLRQSGGLRRSFFESQDAREKEVKTLRRWYDDSGRAAFEMGQKSRRLNADERQPYLTTSGPSSVNVLLGPINDPQLVTLEKGSRINIAEPFKGSNGRRGWLFNLGARIREAQWAVNEERSTQYLAVAVEQIPTGRQPKPLEQPQAPAFTATKPYPASIQIWEFEATADGELNTSQDPQLKLVICTDWGVPKHFRWCPIEATDGSELLNDNDAAHVGLLAGIWSDGRVRILDIYMPTSNVHTTAPHYIHYSRAAFDVALPHTIPTCLHWLSGTSIAVGTAAGTVAIWTLTRPGALASEGVGSSSKPWFYKQLADTYILTISSGWPSQPQYLSISIADGFSRLFDLRSPIADTTASIRGRTLCLTQAWHEHTQSFAMPDEHYILKHNPIRRYYHNLYSMRSDSSITRISASPVHPGVLIGGAEGNVEASNPVGRITNYKVIPWQQKWFVHEWRRPVEELVVKPAAAAEDVEMVEGGPVEDLPSTATADDKAANTSGSRPNKVPQSVLSQPLVRITEGYKATQPGIQHSVTSKKPTNPEVGKGITVFEEQSAITALAWNPNLKFGTWAVAGMGSGLLRVEDIGV